MVVKFHILGSVRKVRLYPRECKAINSKVGLKSLQQYLVVDSVKCRREVQAYHDGAIALATYVGEIIENV